MHVPVTGQLSQAKTDMDVFHGHIRALKSALLRPLQP
jgi:hypothetical protein